MRTPSAMSRECLGEHETVERTPEQRSKLREHQAPAWRWSVLHVFKARAAAVFNAHVAGMREPVCSSGCQRASASSSSLSRLD